MDDQGAQVHLILPRRLRAQVIAHARSEAPREACGILAGVAPRVNRVYRLRNIADSPATRYLADPSGQLAAFEDMERTGVQLLAIYHSHPGSPAVPSPTDLSLAFYPDACHVIVSLTARRPVLRCYAIADGAYVGVQLTAGTPRAARLSPAK
jgi:proteasome lid subunit RPN8/RPN11